MIQRIFEGVYWQVGEDPMSLHSGRVLPMDKVARHILKTPHGCTCVDISIAGHDNVQAAIPRHIMTCIDLIRWINVSALRGKGTAIDVHTRMNAFTRDCTLAMRLQ